MTTRFARTGCALLLLVLAGRPAAAWDPPRPQSTGDPNHPENPEKAVLSNTLYENTAHGYIIEHAARLLKEAGHPNWADAIYQYRHDLMDGTMWPDRKGERHRLRIYVTFLGIEIDEKYNIDLGNEASYAHYYDPDSGSGLRLGYWRDLIERTVHGSDDLVKLHAILTAAGGPAGWLIGWAFSAEIEIVPYRAFLDEYPPAILGCQENFSKALAAWRGTLAGQDFKEGRGREGTAMFYLGAACHFLADMAVVGHSFQTFAGQHENYESNANRLADYDGSDDTGEYGEYRKYHADRQNDIPLGLKSGFPGNPGIGEDECAAALADQVARRIKTIEQYQWVEGKDAAPGPEAELGRYMAGSWGELHHSLALRQAIPLAEAYAASLFARFFTALGIPSSVPPIEGMVRDVATKQPVPGAYVFYRNVHYLPAIDGFKPPVRDPEWSLTQADRDGRFTVPVPLRPSWSPLTVVNLRPAMPGYSFEGEYITGTGDVPQKMGFAVPVPLAHGEFQTEAKQVLLRLRPLPKEGVISGFINVALVQQAAAKVAALPPHDLRALRVLHRASPLALQPVFQDKTPLPLSKTVVSAALAGEARRITLEVCRVSDTVLSGEGDSQPTHPDKARVVVQVNHLLDLFTANLITSQLGLAGSLDKTRAFLKGATPQKLMAMRLAGAELQVPASGDLRDALAAVGKAPLLPDPKLGLKAQPVLVTQGSLKGHMKLKLPPPKVQNAKAMEQHFKKIQALLPREDVIGPDGKPMSVALLRSEYAKPGLRDSLLAHGIVPVPSMAGVGIEVSIVPSPGYLGSVFTMPLKLTTDAKGQAAFDLAAGSHAGRIRLLIRVTYDPAVQYPLPSTEVEFLVQPRWTVDPSPLKHPSLISLAPNVVAWAGHPKSFFKDPMQKTPIEPFTPKPAFKDLVQKAPLEPFTPKLAQPRLRVRVVQQALERGPGGIALRVQPVPGADVKVLLGPRQAAAGKSSEAGIFETGPLAPGLYDVQVAKEGYRPQSADADVKSVDVQKDIVLARLSTPAIVPKLPDVRPGTPPEVRPLPPPEEATLLVQVVERDAHGELIPVGGAQVVVNWGDREIRQVASGQSGPNGAVSFRVRRDNYAVVATKAGYEPGRAGASLMQGDTRAQVFLERRGAQTPVPLLTPAEPVLRLRVVRAGTDQGVAGAHVVITRNRVQVASGDANPDGRYVARLQPGDYTLDVTSPGYRAARETLGMGNAGTERQVSLTPELQVRPIQVPVLPWLRVRVVDAQGRGPVAGAQIVVRQQGQQVAAGVSDAAGSFSVALRAGAYRVDVSAPPRFVPGGADVTMGTAEQTCEVVLQRLRID